MIVLSLVLVIVAAVALIAGFFQTGLTLIYVAIVSCVLAMAFLGIGVLQRKRSSGKPASAGAYGSGSSSSGAAAPRSTSGSSSAPARSSGGGIEPVRPKEPVGSAVGAGGASEADSSDTDSTQVIVRKTAAADAAKRGADAPRKKAVVKKAVARPPATEPAEGEAPVAATKKASAAKKASTKAAAAKKSPRAGAKKAASKKTTTEKAGTKKTGTKKASTPTGSAARKAPAKKASAKKSATRTSGGGKAEARSILAGVKGLGPAKQDAVLAEFGSVAALRQASEEQLADIRGIGDGLARSIKDAVG